MIRKLLFVGLVCTLALTTASAAPLGTAFSFSGRLKYQGQSANGDFDLLVTNFDAAIGGNAVGNPHYNNLIGLACVDGLFVTNMNFGAVFDGNARWLEIWARPTPKNNQNPQPYQMLSPRQPISPSPHALFASNANTALIAATSTTANGVSANAVGTQGLQDASVTTDKLAPNSVTAGKIASGQVVKSLNNLFDDVTLVAGANVTLTPNNNNRTITIDSSSVVAAGWSLTGNAGTTSGVNFLGTTDNQPLEIQVHNSRALRLEHVVRANGASLESSVNLLAGYTINSISGGVLGGTIAGGGASSSSGAQFFDFPNRVTGDYGTVGGGQNNMAGGYATVPGGSANSALGAFSFAAGRYAKANDDSAFVWNSYDRPASSFMPSRFHVFAQNGFSVDYDAQQENGGGAHWAGFGLEVGRTISTWTGAHLDDNGDWYGRYVIATGEGGEGAYIGGDGAGNDVELGSRNPTIQDVVLWNTTTGLMNLTTRDASVRTLTIRGGADLAEPFQVSEAEIPKGSVVIIDAEHPGKLRLSTEPYDTRVAGVISGAGGVQPGIQMTQAGVLEGTQNVALTGRVYVLADASHGPIKPGDLLTTSATPGHAMKVTDPARAQGSILGKAMSTLVQGKGMVLVLVTLQ